MYVFAPLRTTVRKIGLWTALIMRLSYYLDRCVYRVLPEPYLRPLIRVSILGYPHPVYLRLGSSDVPTFDQVFVQEQYSPAANLSISPKSMIDCGANVGYATLYFLNRYPDLTAIAVEPDSANLEVCRRNLSAYSDHVQIFQAGVWNCNSRLVLSGTGWGVHVRQASLSEASDVEGLDLNSLIEALPAKEVDLLKVDIEGSELVVFDESSGSWLPRVRNIAIELHGEQCSAKFFKALRNYRYDLSESGELTLCLNLRSSSTAGETAGKRH
jgi:FkbM family methyltransferase